LDPVFEAARGFSYPSGHAMSAMTFYGLLIYIVWQKIENKVFRWTLIILLTSIVFLIGFSRVYLRVHYASDVLAGFSVGIIWLVISLWVMGKIENYTRKEVAPAINEEP
jgi:membrane-associated phospholipid phosphatase